LEVSCPDRGDEQQTAMKRVIMVKGCRFNGCAEIQQRDSRLSVTVKSEATEENQDAASLPQWIAVVRDQVSHTSHPQLSAAKATRIMLRKFC
jgi:hypothetical protein